MKNNESIILLEGDGIKEEHISISLGNAKQVIKGYIPGWGLILYLAADTTEALRDALIEFAKVPNVKGVSTLIIRSSSS